MTRWSLRGYWWKRSTAKCWQKTEPKLYFVKRIVEQRDKQREMEADGCSRKGSEVMKINIPLVWTSLCCSPCGTLVHFLRVSSANVSLLLYFSSCFILMPQWDCDITYVGPLSHTAVLSSAIAFNQPLALIYYFLLSSGLLHFTTLSVQLQSETLAPLVLGSADRKA